MVLALQLFSISRLHDSGTIRNAVLRRTTSTPTLMRYGISETVELRLEGDSYIRETTDGSGT